MSKKLFILGMFCFSALLVGGAFFLYGGRFKLRQAQDISQISTSTADTQQVQATSHGPCLKENEVVEYDRISQHPLITQPKDTSPVIYVRNKTTGKTVNSFLLDNILVSGHPMEVHNCGIYVVRAFNYDPKKAKQEMGFRDELWKYDYRGEKKMLILLSEKLKEYIEYYSTEFRFDSKENYVSLVRGYLGKNDYALIIKNLSTLEDVFVLPITEIEKRNPDLVQDIAFVDWTSDGHYFWARTHYGANTLGFIRIDTETWNFDLLPAPKGVLGGDALNLEKGLITIHPGNVWFGVAQIEEQEKARRRVQGIGTELYIHNLITGERKFVVKTDEPLWYFKPKWLSDTELEYTIPSGEKKVYKLQ